MSASLDRLLDIRLTKDVRREVCIHEAAHAVIGAIGGASILAVAVAPAGAPLFGSGVWTYRDRQGVVCEQVWGICESDEISCASRFVHRVEDEDGDGDGDGAPLFVDRDGFRAALTVYMRRGAEAIRRAVRAEICFNLAGRIAEAIAKDEEVWSYVWLDIYDICDTSRAEAMALLLPYRNEYQHAVEVTERMLRRPDVWAMVLRLADELERCGEIGADDKSDSRLQSLLPAHVPNWPPSPRARKVASDELANA